jgi:tetratricopeptide (TPR) repeat protein
MRRSILLFVTLACLGFAHRAVAAPDAPELPTQLAGLGLDTGEILRWHEGVALESEERMLEAIERYALLARAHPESAFLAWRIARNHWRRGERLPRDAKAERREAFRGALHWSDRAMSADPQCGECVFWKMAAMGRLATTVGAVESASMAGQIAELIDRGIALNPTYSDNEWNHTLANLYFASSAFYRMVPDWFWLEWVLGVRGDKDRALAYIESALEMAPQRVDYNLEHGVVLTCIGVDRDDEVALARGRASLERARELPHLLGTDAIDQESAALLLRRPALACGYSRDGFVDFSEVKRAGAL